MEQKACDDVLTEFRNFLENNYDSLNRHTTVSLLGSHGRIDELLHYARVIDDLEWVIEHYIQNCDYDKALEVFVIVEIIVLFVLN